MELLVVRYLSIGNIQLGQSVDQVRSNCFLRGERPELTDEFTDFFDEPVVHVAYENRKVVFIGVSPPGLAKYQHFQLLELTFGEIDKLFAPKDHNVYVEEDHSILYLDTGLCFYSDEMEETNKPQEVGVFVHGYYDSLLGNYQKR